MSVFVRACARALFLSFVLSDLICGTEMMLLLAEEKTGL